MSKIRRLVLVFIVLGLLAAFLVPSFLARSDKHSPTQNLSATPISLENIPQETPEPEIQKENEELESLGIVGFTACKIAESESNSLFVYAARKICEHCRLQRILQIETQLAKAELKLYYLNRKYNLANRLEICVYRIRILGQHLSTLNGITSPFIAEYEISLAQFGQELNTLSEIHESLPELLSLVDNQEGVEQFKQFLDDIENYQGGLKADIERLPPLEPLILVFEKTNQEIDALLDLREEIQDVLFEDDADLDQMESEISKLEERILQAYKRFSNQVLFLSYLYPSISLQLQDFHNDLLSDVKRIEEFHSAISSSAESD